MDSSKTQILKSGIRVDDFTANGVTHGELADRTTDQSIKKNPDHEFVWTVMILIVLFGMSSNIGLFGFMADMSLLVQKAPETWRLPSYVSLIMTLANIIPWTYSLYQKFSPFKFNDSMVITAVHTLSTITLVLSPLYLRKTVQIGDSAYSLPIYLTAFLLAVNTATSYMVYVPYVARFRQQYLVFYFIGEGLGTLIPSLITLTQGVGDTECRVASNATDGVKYEKYIPPPNFEVESYLYIVFAFMFVCTVGFVLLDRLPLSKKAYDEVKISKGGNFEYEDKIDGVERQKVSDSQYYALLALMTFLSIMTSGFLPSLQSFSTLPYSDSAYHYATLVGLGVHSISSFIAIFLPKTSMKITIATVLGTVAMGTYLIVTAAMNPNPPFVGTSFGEIFIIFIWGIEESISIFCKICVLSLVRLHGGRAMVWAGSLRQAGTVAGAVVTFFLINYADIFHSTAKC